MITLHGLNGVTNPLVRMAIPALVKEIKFRSAFSEEDVLVTGEELISEEKKDKPTTPASKTLRILKPTFTIESPTLGTQVLAPWGEAKPGEAADNRQKAIWGTVLLSLGCIGAGMLIGKFVFQVGKKTITKVARTLTK